MICRAITNKSIIRYGFINRSIFLKAENTPNPHSIKFVTEEIILPEKFGTGMFYQKGQLKDILKSPLARKIFEEEDVKSCFFGRNFVTVTKEVDDSWLILKPRILTCILDFLSENKPIIVESNEVSDTAILDTDDEIVATIKELIETRVRPAVQEDGGDIFYAGFDPLKGIVQVRLAGSCVGCPSSSVTLRNGVEKMLMHYIPEVKGIEEVSSVTTEGESSSSSSEATHSETLHLTPSTPAATA